MKTELKTVNIVLPNSTYDALVSLAKSQGILIEHYVSLMLTELTAAKSSEATVAQESRTNQSLLRTSPATHPKPATNRRVPETQLMAAIITYLKEAGGVAPKTAVEETLFEKYKTEFQEPYYTELVGGGVPRWKKNVQFARNTAKNTGLIKPPEQSGRGTWELTDKGRSWQSG